MVVSNRIKYIDIARGIAILCIILGHLGEPQINRIVFTFHVPIYFLITGYFINKKLNIKDFIKSKAKTLLIPYICTCFIIILLGGIEHLIYEGGTEAIRSVCEWIYASLYGAGDSYSEPFYIKQIGAIWFLWATFWASIFLRIILDKKRGTRILAVLLLFVAGYWSRKLFWFPLSIQAGCCAVLFMYFGHLFCEVKEPLSKFTIESKTALSILALVTWLHFVNNFQSFWLVHCDIGHGITDIIGCICGCYIILLLSKYIEKHAHYSIKWLSFLGHYSLFVLCIHNIELSVFPWKIVLQFLASHGMPEYLGLYLKIILKFLFIIPTAVVCSKWNFTRKLFGFPVIIKEEKKCNG